MKPKKRTKKQITERYEAIGVIVELLDAPKGIVSDATRKELYVTLHRLVKEELGILSEWDGIKPPPASSP